MTDTKQPSGAPLADLIQAGAMMANCMYNYAQRGLAGLAVPECENFDRLRKQWDAARSAMKTAPDMGIPISEPVQVGGLTDDQLHRIWMGLTDVHVMSESAFIAVYRAILAQAVPVQQAAPVPAGWKLVPIEPTHAMLDEAGRRLQECVGAATVIEFQADAHTAWDGMLSAAPHPGEQG